MFWYLDNVVFCKLTGGNGLLLEKMKKEKSN